jgi:cytochrome P450
MDEKPTITSMMPEDPARQAELFEFTRQRAQDPRTYFTNLRERCVVDFDEGEFGAIQVLRRADVENVLRDAEIYSTAMGIQGSEEPLIPMGIDPPEHGSYRKIIDPLFSPRRMAALQPAVVEHTHRLIDTFVDNGECDFSSELAAKLPGTVFLVLLGLPLDELDTLIYWKDVMLRPTDIAGSFEAGEKLQAETSELVYQRLHAALDEHRRAPREDLISYLLSATYEQERPLTDSEIVRILYLLLSAGLDTVTISLEAIFHHLAQHPEDRDMIVRDPDTQTNLIEELLRWESPVISPSPRIALRDHEIAGCPIAKGSYVLPILAAANIDPEVEGASMLDTRRGGKGHLTFGGGPHRCLGSHLARMELRTVVREWHRRIPDYRLKPGTTIVWTNSILRGIDYLPLEWDVASTLPRPEEER